MALNRFLDRAKMVQFCASQLVYLHIFQDRIEKQIGKFENREKPALLHPMVSFLFLRPRPRLRACLHVCRDLQNMPAAQFFCF